MVAHLEWDRNERADAPSVQELDHILDRLTAQARASRPFSVDLFLDSGDALAIVVGGEVSVMNFYSPTHRPPVVGCRGLWSEDEAEELIVFDFRGEYSEIEKRYTVPTADAREGMRRFFITGERPDNITWGV